MSDLADKQALFMENLTKLLLHGPHLVKMSTGVAMRFRLGEGYIGDSIDKPHEDTPHLRKGTHFKRTGIDLIVDIFVPTTNKWTYLKVWHPVYQVLGSYWKSLSPECRWGGDFSNRDYNHFSILTDGVA